MTSTFVLRKRLPSFAKSKNEFCKVLRVDESERRIYETKLPSCETVEMECRVSSSTDYFVPLFCPCSGKFFDLL